MQKNYIKNIMERLVVNMENKSNEELLKELEKSLIWMSIKTEQNKYDEVDKLQEKVDKLKAEILKRMK